MEKRRAVASSVRYLFIAQCFFLCNLRLSSGFSSARSRRWRFARTTRLLDCRTTRSRPSPAASKSSARSLFLQHSRIRPRSSLMTMRTSGSRLLLASNAVRQLPHTLTVCLIGPLREGPCPGLNTLASHGVRRLRWSLRRPGFSCARSGSRALAWPLRPKSSTRFSKVASHSMLLRCSLHNAGFNMDWTLAVLVGCILRSGTASPTSRA